MAEGGPKDLVNEVEMEEETFANVDVKRWWPVPKTNMTENVNG